MSSFEVCLPLRRILFGLFFTPALARSGPWGSPVWLGWLVIAARTVAITRAFAVVVGLGGVAISQRFGLSNPL